MRKKAKRKPPVTNRWTGTTLEERQAYARKLRQAPGSAAGAGRPRATDRCPCGRYTRWLAVKRRHRCTAPVAAVD